MVGLRFLLPLLFVLSACGADAKPVLRGPPLPRLWTLGPAASDLPGRRIEVTLTAEGRILVDGAAVDLEGLRRRLVAFADEARDEGSFSRPGTGLLVIRCHRDLPWRAAEFVLTTTGDPRVRLYRVVFAVTSPDEGPEGTFATFLQTAAGFGYHLKRDPGDRGFRVEARTTTDLPVAPAVLATALKRPPDPVPYNGFELAAGPDVPVEYALRVADLIHRAGFERLYLFASSTEMLKQPVPTTALTRGVRPGLRIQGRNLEPTGPAPEPEVIRRTEPAGFAEAPPPPHRWYFTRPGRSVDPDLDAWRDALAALQEEDGSWDGCDVAATALAVLSFLRSNATHKDERWGRTVKRGLAFLKRHQDRTGSFAEEDRAQSLALVALVEAYLRTHSPLFKQSAGLALNHTLRRALSAPATAWLALAWPRLREPGLPCPTEWPAGWTRGEAGEEDARLLEALSGGLDATRLAAWREEVRSIPPAGRAAGDLSRALLLLASEADEDG